MTAFHTLFIRKEEGCAPPRVKGLEALDTGGDEK
jgi:hypothetical protein